MPMDRSVLDFLLEKGKYFFCIVRESHQEYNRKTWDYDTITTEQVDAVIVHKNVTIQYHIPEKLEMPDVPTYEPEHPYKQTEFQKLSSFNRKEKNQARKKLEHQALKYQNKHWKK